MNVCAKIFKDDSYKYLVDPKPVPVAALLCNSDAGKKDIFVRLMQCPYQTTNRVHFTAISSEDEILKRKDRGATLGFEGYQVQGILKRNWCKKHQTAVFGCVIVLFDWDIVKINDRLTFEQAVASRVEKVRARIKGTNTRLFLLLHTNKGINEGVPPSGSYLHTDDAFSSLRSRCSLDEKSFAILHRDDQKTVDRIHKGILDICSKYHRDEATRIKKYKSDLYKTSNTAGMMARYRFKVGFHYDILDDVPMKKRNYEKCYNQLRSLPLTPEVRVLSSLVILRLSTGLATSNLAELDKTIRGFLEHIAWVSAPYSSAMFAKSEEEAAATLLLKWSLSETYQLFAGLLRKAYDSRGGSSIVAKNLVGTPGYSYACSADILRGLRDDILSQQNQLEELESTSASDVSDSPLHGIASSEYLGQEHTHCESPKALYRRLLTIPGYQEISYSCAEMYGMAMSYYRDLGLLKQCIVFGIRVAEHHLTVGEYGTALQQLSNHVEDATLRKWPSLTAELHKMIVKCCRQVSRPLRLLQSLIHLLSNTSISEPGHRTVMTELQKLCKKESMMDLFDDIAIDQKKQALVLEHQLTLTENEDSFLHADVGFSHAYCEAMEGSVTLRVRMTTQCKVPLPVSHVVLHMHRMTTTSSSGLVNSEGEKAETEAVEGEFGLSTPVPDYDIRLDSISTFDVTHPLDFTKTMAFDEHGIYEVKKLTIILGKCIELTLPFENPPGFYRKLFHHKFEHLMEHSVLEGEYFPHRPAIRVVRPVPRATFTIRQFGEHAVEGEDYPVSFIITSHADHMLDSVMHLTTIPEAIQLVETRSGQVVTDSTGEYLHQQPLPDVHPGETIKVTIVLHCLKAGKFKMPIRLEYRTLRCGSMSVTQDFQLHVCYPVFVSFTVSDTLEWYPKKSQLLEAGKQKAGGKLKSSEEEAGHVPFFLSSDSTSAMFIESPEMRDLGESADIFGNMSFGSEAAVGDSANIGGSGGPTGQGVLSANFYTAQQSQVPTETRHALQPLVLRTHTPFTVTCKFVNSLQFPLVLHRAFVAVVDGSSSAVLSDQSFHEVFLPTRIGVDEEYTFTVTLSNSTPGHYCLGSAVLSLSREVFKGGRKRDESGELVSHHHTEGDPDTAQAQQKLAVQDDNEDEEDFLLFQVTQKARIEFQLPLPTATFIDAPAKVTMEYPPSVTVGESFPFVCHVTNNTDDFLDVDLQLLLPISGGGVAAKLDGFIISGPVSWTGQYLTPHITKAVSFMLTAVFSGRHALPNINATCLKGDVSLVRSDDVRYIYVYPQATNLHPLPQA